MANIDQLELPNGTTYDINDATKVLKTGDTMTGKLIVPKTRIANTCYGVSFGKTTSTPVETILYTGIKWVSSAHMPVVHITGYAYGLQAPVEFKIGFYIFADEIGYCGACNMGAWQPDVYLFKYTRDSVNYVAVGFSGSCYFLQLQADVQDEMGKFNYISMDDANWSWEFLTTAGTIPTPDSGTTCIQVPYKANILGTDKLPLAGGQMTGTIITPKNDTMGIRPNTSNWGEVGDPNYYFYKAYITNYYGSTSHVNNWDSNRNIGTSSSSSAAATRGYVNFYNECAAGGTQTKTTLYANANATANTNISMPTTSGTLALTDGSNASGTWEINISGSATKLGTSNVGSATQSIYLNGGTPTATTYTLGKSVPSDAVFTDHYAWSDITNKPSSYTPASHTHGNIQNSGTLQTSDITIASGDKLVVTDSSDSNKVARTSVSFDGSTTTKCLTQKGTWESFSNNTGTVTSVKVGTTGYDPVNGVVSLPAYPSGGGAVDDVQVNGTSVVSSGVANIPLVSSASAGVAPKGTSVSTQSQSTKFLREDGTWARPSYTTNTTYTFAEGTTDGTFKVTPSGGSAQSVAVHNVVKKTGDTVTGTLTFNTPPVFKTSSVDISADDMGGDGTGISVGFKDKNNLLFSDISSMVDDIAPGTYPAELWTSITQFGKKSDGTSIDNYFRLKLSKSGDVGYAVKSPAAFRDAINVVNRSAESGGTNISLVTTGDKYNWNNSVNKNGDNLSGVFTFTSDDTNEVIGIKSSNRIIDVSSTYGSLYDCIKFLDKNGNTLGEVNVTDDNNGSVWLSLEASNKDTSGNNVRNTFTVKATKSGNQSYAVSNPTNFRSAIGIQDSPSVIEPTTSQVKLTSGTYTDLASFVLTPGTWVISYKGQFAGATGGLRRVLLGGSGASTAWNNTRTTAFASSDNVMEIGWTTVVTVSSSTTRYLVGYQNSGSDVNCTGYVQAVRINPV